MGVGCCSPPHFQICKGKIKNHCVNLVTQEYNTYHSYVHIPYSTKSWQGKTLANQSFQSFSKESVGKFTIANVSYFSESGIWLGKILANDFPRQNFALYVKANICIILNEKSQIKEIMKSYCYYCESLSDHTCFTVPWLYSY